MQFNKNVGTSGWHKIRILLKIEFANINYLVYVFVSCFCQVLHYNAEVWEEKKHWIQILCISGWSSCSKEAKYLIKFPRLKERCKLCKVQMSISNIYICKSIIFRKDKNVEF